MHRFEGAPDGAAAAYAGSGAPPPVRVHIGLGSNLDDPPGQVRRALDALAQIPRSRLLRQSRLYRSAPLGPVAQPDYVNAVATVSTHLAAHSLLTELQAIERRQGRVRDGSRWGPRTLDLDLLLYSEARIDTQRLNVPHPGIAARDFVLVPLVELCPALVIPGLGPVLDLLQALPAPTLQPLSP